MSARVRHRERLAFTFIFVSSCFVWVLKTMNEVKSFLQFIDLSSKSVWFTGI